ncbi:MAG: hypothetical protein QM675_00805 [Protaetiibacter sp.]
MPGAGSRSGQTHAWFPAAQFDEVIDEGDWLVGRLGDGRRIVAAIGDTALDGEASTFRYALGVIVPRRTVADPGVRWMRDGHELELDWDGELLVDGAPRPVPREEATP